MLKFTLQEGKTQPTLHNQYQACWWLGSYCRQDISRHGINLILMKCLIACVKTIKRFNLKIYHDAWGNIVTDEWGKFKKNEINGWKIFYIPNICRTGWQASRKGPTGMPPSSTRRRSWKLQGKEETDISYWSFSKPLTTACTLKYMV